MFVDPGDTLKNAGSDALNKLTKGMDALGRATKITDANIINLAANLSRLALPTEVLRDTEALRELSYDLVQETMGQTRIIGQAVAHSMGEATFETLQFGVSLDDNLNLMKQINSVMKVNTLLTTEQVVNMQAIAKSAGVTAAELVPIVEGFANIGVGTNDAIENIESMSKQARLYGINVGEFMKGISNNIKQLSTYNFKAGIEGFSRMVAKAQALRMDVSKTFSLTESLLDPEKAIETAAGFQMLGGAVGDLGDPFKLLYMAQNDVEGLQDSILNMAESAVVFNEETGQFDIPVTEMYRLREAAKLTGMDINELSNTAIKSRERTQKLGVLDAFTDLSEEEKELIANMADIDGKGQMTVTLPYEDDGVMKTKTLDATQLTADELKELRKVQQDNDASAKDIALSQLTALETINNTIKSSEAATVMAGVNTAGVSDALDAGEAMGKTLMEGLNNSINAESMEDYGYSLTQALAKGLNDPDTMSGFQAAAGVIGQTMMDEVIMAPEKYKEKIEQGNIFKGLDLDTVAAEKLHVLGQGITSVGQDLLNMLPPDVVAQIKQGAAAVGGMGAAFKIVYESIGGEILGDIMSIIQSNAGTTAGSIIQSNAGTTAGDLSNVVNSVNNSTASANGNVNLNVDGKIDLTVDGKNLPNNIDTEQLAMEIVNNPNFRSRLVKKITDADNSYSA
jgi:hypothetical protein